MSKPNRREREEGEVETPAEREQRDRDPYEILNEVSIMLKETNPQLKYEAMADYVFKATLRYIPDKAPESVITLQAERTATCQTPVVRMSVGTSDTFLTIEASQVISRPAHVFNVVIEFISAPKEKRDALMAVQKYSDEHLLGLRWILCDQLILKQNDLRVAYIVWKKGYMEVKPDDTCGDELTVRYVNSRALVSWQLNPNAVDSVAYSRETQRPKRKLDDVDDEKKASEPQAYIPVVRKAWNDFLDTLSSAVERSHHYLRECAAICESNLTFNDVNVSMVELALVFRHADTDVTLMVPVNGTIILQISSTAKEFTIHDSPAKVMITFARSIVDVLRTRRESAAVSESSKK